MGPLLKFKCSQQTAERQEGMPVPKAADDPQKRDFYYDDFTETPQMIKIPRPTVLTNTSKSRADDDSLYSTILTPIHLLPRNPVPPKPPALPSITSENYTLEMPSTGAATSANDPSIKWSDDSLLYSQFSPSTVSNINQQRSKKAIKVMAVLLVLLGVIVIAAVAVAIYFGVEATSSDNGDAVKQHTTTFSTTEVGTTTLSNITDITETTSSVMTSSGSNVVIGNKQKMTIIR